MKRDFINAQLPGLIQKFGTGLVQNMLKQAGVNPPIGSIKDKLKRKDIIITFTSDDFERLDQRDDLSVRVVRYQHPVNAPNSVLKRGALQSMLNILKNEQTPDSNIIINIEKGNNFGLFVASATNYHGKVTPLPPPYQDGMQSNGVYQLDWFPKKNMHGIKYNKVTINFNCDVYSGELGILNLFIITHEDHGVIMNCIPKNDTFPFTAIKEYQTININGNNPQNAKVKYI